MANYEDFRCKIKSGDVVAFSRPGIVTFFTNSPYSHVGLIWKVSGRLFVIEAVSPYIRIVPLSNFAKEGFHIISMKTPMSSAETEFALSTVGMSKYSFKDCVLAYFKKLKIGKDSAYQCAELTITARLLSGVNLGGVATPEAVVESAISQGYELTQVKGT